MRNYLFRGKRKDNGEWIHGYLTICDERYFIVEEGKVGCLCFDTLPKGHYVFMEYIEVIPETVGLCVGEVFLADSKFSKTKIFEGDVLEVLMVDLPENAVDYREPIELVKRRGVVRYHEDLNEFRLRIYKNGEYHMRIQLWSYGLKKLEVIGNIHDTPDILKGGVTYDN